MRRVTYKDHDAAPNSHSRTENASSTSGTMATDLEDRISRVDPKTLAALQDFKARLERRFGERLRGVYLFGSRARGDHEDDSDADVAVLLDGLDYTDRAVSREVIDEATEVLIDRAIDIQPWTVPPMFLRHPEMSEAPHLVYAILRDGVAI